MVSENPSSNPAGVYKNKLIQGRDRPALKKALIYHPSGCRIETSVQWTNLFLVLGTSVTRFGDFSLWATFYRLWQQLICPNLPHS